MTRRSPTELRVPWQRSEGIAFTEGPDGYRGTGARAREWHITRALTGWRLEFTDPQDDAATFAGVHRTLAEAQMEAGR